jgi:hypothetical protein
LKRAAWLVAIGGCAIVALGAGVWVWLGETPRSPEAVEEMKKLGCVDAWVSDFRQRPSELHEGEAPIGVTCVVAAREGAPSCEAVFAAYRRKEPKTDESDVLVGVRPKSGLEVCTVRYAADGKPR